MEPVNVLAHLRPRDIRYAVAVTSLDMMCQLAAHLNFQMIGELSNVQQVVRMTMAVFEEVFTNDPVAFFAPSIVGRTFAMADRLFLELSLAVSPLVADTFCEWAKVTFQNRFTPGFLALIDYKTAFAGWRNSMVHRGDDFFGLHATRASQLVEAYDRQYRIPDLAFRTLVQTLREKTSGRDRFVLGREGFNVEGRLTNDSMDFFDWIGPLVSARYFSCFWRLTVRGLDNDEQVAIWKVVRIKSQAESRGRLLVYPWELSPLPCADRGGLTS